MILISQSLYRREEEKKMNLYWVAQKELYERGLKALASRHVENPFVLETFPMYKDIEIDEETGVGRLIATTGDDELFHYITDGGVLNKMASNSTDADIYNVVTGEKIKAYVDAHLEGETILVIKIADLGSTVEEGGFVNASNESEEVMANKALMEIYNEIRVGFFLNELRYAYDTVLTRHFMTIVDWFVSDINLYPEKGGVGPYQYIVSERLNASFLDYLTRYPDMATLKCLLFCIAQALEAAWATHRYIHYDLHCDNVMLKESTTDKNYVYTRPYSNKTYRLPRQNVHNMVVKILDYGRNRMKIPLAPVGKDKLDLYEHIETNGKHKHDQLVAYTLDTLGVGVGENRTWDLRRLFWDMMITMPTNYWLDLQKNSPYEYTMLLFHMGVFINITRINTMNWPSKLFRLKNSTVTGPLTMKELLIAPIHYLYRRFKSAYKDAQYTQIKGKENRHAYIAQEFDAAGYTNNFKDAEKLLSLYAQWESDTSNALITSSIASDTNATSFLSSVFFNEFVVTITGEDDIWMGQRPSGKILSANETY